MYQSIIHLVTNTSITIQNRMAFLICFAFEHSITPDNSNVFSDPLVSLCFSETEMKDRIIITISREVRESYLLSQLCILCVLFCWKVWWEIVSRNTYDCYTLYIFWEEIDVSHRTLDVYVISAIVYYLKLFTIIHIFYSNVI